MCDGKADPMLLLSRYLTFDHLGYITKIPIKSFYSMRCVYVCVIWFYCDLSSIYKERKKGMLLLDLFRILIATT
jgi:hypothetical protein